MSSDPRFYDTLADWWPLFSPPDHYDEEAADILSRLAPHAAAGIATLLELGCGGGSLTSHLKSRFTLTLTDRSPSMLAVSRAGRRPASAEPACWTALRHSLWGCTGVGTGPAG